MHGFVDMGTNIESEDDNAVHAKNAFVFMAVGINGHWKIPIGYFLVAGLNGSERSNLLEQCLNLMSETGAKVHSVTFDGAYTNATMCSKLGASFDINDDSIFVYKTHLTMSQYLYFMMHVICSNWCETH